MVDGSILILFSILVYLILLKVGVFVPAIVSKIILVLLGVAQFLYFPLFESSSRQGTYGKSLMGLKVTDISGNRISFLRALGRNLAKIISGMILMIGYLMAGFTSKKQGLHDMIAGTLIIKEKPAKTGLVILAIFGPTIVYVIGVVFFSSLLAGMLGFGLGSTFSNFSNLPNTSSVNIQPLNR